MDCSKCSNRIMELILNDCIEYCNLNDELIKYIEHCPKEQTEDLAKEGE